MTLSTLIADRHKRASRMLGYALTLGDAEAWTGFADLIGARLTEHERAALTLMALRSLSDENAATICEARQPARAQPPIPPLIGYMDEATFWADQAEPEALEAYCLASFNAMSGQRQADFLGHVQGRLAA